MPDIPFHTRYAPLIANPFVSCPAHLTVPASRKLRPYIRCFWGSSVAFNPHAEPFYDHTLLIPDTCFDIILIRDNPSGAVKLLFAGMNDTYTFDSWSESDTDITLFAVRLNFWALSFLSQCPMDGTLNAVISPLELFPDLPEFAEQIFETPGFTDRMALAETYVAARIDARRSPALFLECTGFMLKRRGTASLADLSGYTGYSPRHLQRLFARVLSVPPGRLMNLIRYQSVWRDVLLSNQPDYLSLVLKYGYSDQSHLIADFKKYHSMTPREALRNSGRPNAETPLHVLERV